jgi:hypothetical protein
MLRIMYFYTWRSETMFGRANPGGGGASVKKEGELVGLNILKE